MTADMCNTVTLNGVIIQENGIIRNNKGNIIGRLIDTVNFESKHIQNVKVKEEEND